MNRCAFAAVLAALFLALLPVSSRSESKVIMIGESVRGAMYAPFYIADARGYFKKRDLDPRIITFSRSNDINALVAGDIQFDLLSPDKAIHSALGGFPVKTIMGTVRGLNLALLVQPSIKTAADLKGKPIAISGFSGLPFTALLLCLKELGLTKDQVVPLSTGGKTERYEALLSNKVPAAILDPPFTTMAAKKGMKALVDLANLDVPYLRSVVAVTEKSLQQDHANVSRFVEAVSEGILFYKNPANREESIRVLAKYLRVSLDKNRPMVEEGYDTYRGMTVRKPYPDPNGLKIILETVAESNPKAKGVNPASFVDASFVERLDKTGFFERNSF
jgi:NitT/TauT family transport system substrate-binding protein